MSVLVSDKDLKLIISAVWDAKLWQDSIEDAHRLTGDTTRELESEANKALRLSRRYERLHDKLRSRK